ncbi:unnamed protein product [Prunus armeniaca]
MVKDKKKESSGSTRLSSLISSCFFVSSSASKDENVRRGKFVTISSRTEATMVAAAKFFSSAHKVRFD